MATTMRIALLASAALLGGAAQDVQAKDEQAGTEPAADVMGGQGRGTGSGKSSLEKDLGAQDGTTSRAAEQARVGEAAAGTRAQADRGVSRTPFDPKLGRAGGLREPAER
jgi:hypothetical protein